MQIGLIVGLVLAVALAGSHWYAYEAGGDHRQDAIEAKAAKDQAEAIKEHRANTLIDMDAVAESERKRAAAVLQGVQRRHAIELDIERRAKEQANANNSQPAKPGAPVVVYSCDLDSASLGLLLDSIAAANATAAGAPSVVPAPVPSAPGAR